MARKSISLLGQPITTEDGIAQEAITPGMLVEGVGSILKFSTAGGPAPRNLALEREELGLGITDAYASGDTVKIGSYAPGMHAYALIASGQNISVDAWLEPAADGTVRVFASGTRVARALEAVDNSSGPGNASIRVEVY